MRAGRQRTPRGSLDPVCPNIESGDPYDPHDIPGGIAYGQHWLNVKFQNSLVRVPFRILTKDEEKLLSKNYKGYREAGRGRVQADEEIG